MKRVFGRITAAILISVTLAACGSGSDPARDSGNLTVLAPLHQEGGAYKLTVVELLAVHDLTTLAGQFVKFFFSPRVVGNHLEGISPKTRFILNSDNVYVPTDETTMQMTAIYAHMQKLASLDEELGAKGINKWPRDVGIAVRVAGNLRNNAFYEGKTDSMLVVPYTNKELPIAVNGGILAHEHFHSLFYKVVLADAKANVHAEELTQTLGEDFSETLTGKELLPQPAGESLTDKELNYYYHVAITRGLNEGLADFWGWMYTGDPDFITQSLPAEKERNLKVSESQASRILSGELRIKNEISRRFSFSVSNNVEFNSLVNGYAYMLGTEFSRAMKRYTDLYANAHGIESAPARKEVAKAVVKMLPDLRKELEESETKVFTAQVFIETFVKHIKLSSQEECNYLVTLVNRAPSADSQKTLNCQEDGGQWKFMEISAIPESESNSAENTPPTPSPTPTSGSTSIPISEIPNPKGRLE